MAIQHVTVRVPASTANLGPAFDCLGLALDLHSTFTVEQLPVGSAGPQITIASAWGDDPTLAALPTDEHNLFYRVFAQHLASLGQVVPPVRIGATLGVPSARGLGSSATAVVGGMLAAEAFAGCPIRRAALRPARRRRRLRAWWPRRQCLRRAAGRPGRVTRDMRRGPAWRAVRVPLPANYAPSSSSPPSPWIPLRAAR